MSAHSDPSPRAAYSINETARLLDVSRRQIYDLLSKGKLRSVRIGARQRIPASELERIANGQALPAVADTQAPTGERQIRADDAPAQAVAASEDFEGRPVPAPQKPQAPAAQPARVKLSTLLERVADGCAAR
jgi:excisionase family DNA binding protein